MANQNECKFDLMRLTPELQVKVFEALPSPVAAMDLALTCRGLNILYGTYKTQIMAAIRDNMVAPFYEYYAFLSSLYIPESEIEHPPAGGWANITPENCSGFGKSDFAVDVLRHLPYVAREPGVAGSAIDDGCYAMDYSRATREDFREGEYRSRLYPVAFRGPTGTHKLAFARAYSKSGDAYLFLDTSTGAVVAQGDKVVGPPSDGEAVPVREYFALRMWRCRDLRVVFVPGDNVSGTHVHYAGDDGEGEDPSYDPAVMEKLGGPVFPTKHFDLAQEIDRQWVRHLYRKFGWPGPEWKKEEGLKAILEYRDRRNAEADERVAEMQRKLDETLRRLGPVVGTLRCF